MLVDQATKSIATHYTAVPRNPELALGVAAGPAIVLVALALAVIVVFLAIIGRAAMRAGITPAIPAAVAGGMFANVVDRARLGGVRDFISTPVATVNVADLAIACGIIVLGTALLHHVLVTRSSA